MLSNNQKQNEIKGQVHQLSQKELIHLNMKYQDFLKRHEKCDRDFQKEWNNSTPKNNCVDKNRVF